MTSSTFKAILLGLIIAVTGFSCSNDECDSEPNLNVDSEQLAQDIEAIDAYLESNNITAVEHPSGIRYVIHKEGDGSRPSVCDNVAVAYTGKRLTDQFVFDSREFPIVFPLGNLITGWQIGIPIMKTGGRITLYIPSGYAYGVRGAGSDIPPNSNLIFDITLAGIQ
jgi:FKBP-type peptidyl-prolyl cis-trans isomerase